VDKTRGIKMEIEQKILMEESDKIYAELTKGFTIKQFKLLGELIDTEIEIEGMCNQ